MTARRATTDAVDAKTYDVDAWLAGFTPATVRVRLFKAGHLMGKIDELEQQIKDATPKEDAEQSVADGQLLATLQGRHSALIDEFEASVEWFEFRALSDLHTEAAIAKANRHGHKIDLDHPTPEAMSALRMYQMAETCVSHPGITGEAFIALQRHIGDAPMVALATGWMQSIGLGDPEAPFSQEPSPTPTTPASSES
jgi:hypothetical protein